MPGKRADDSFRWLRCLEASDNVVDRVNIALHLLVPTGLIDSVAEVVVDMNPLMDEFVPHSMIFRQILGVCCCCFFIFVGRKEEMANMVQFFFVFLFLSLYFKLIFIATI